MERSQGKWVCSLKNKVFETIRDGMFHCHDWGDDFEKFPMPGHEGCGWVVD